MTNENLIGVLFIISWPVTFLIGYFTGTALERRWWRGEMIERGHARYYFYDGRWYWNDQVPKPVDPIARKVTEANK